MNIKKNLLDLEYQKYLQFYTATIIIICTYFLGVAVALITKQINFLSIIQLLVVCATSFVVSAIAIKLLINFKRHLKRIPEEMRRL